MSGHSHWSTIQRKKGVADRKRGQIFSKYSRLITTAVKGNPNPETNFKLRLAIDLAKEVNMPKENIERILRKAQGKLGAGFEEVIYEGYGPGKVAILVECLTDNKNRTNAEIKKIFETKGGSLAQSGAVAYQFKRMGLVTVPVDSQKEERMLKLMDLPIEDVEEEAGVIQVYTKPKDLAEIKEKAGQMGIPVSEASLIFKPMTEITISDKKLAERVLSLMEALEDHEEITKTYANFDIQEGVL